MESVFVHDELLFFFFFLSFFPFSVLEFILMLLAPLRTVAEIIATKSR